uniref:Uncharacterized protein n=1 Tax=Avena sativa TaxID=4498 RepID=A0ACD5X8C2_AVESA
MATAAAVAEAAGAGTEAPIAAFAVAKGGVVLKHIYLNGPPTEEARRGRDGDPEEEDPPVLFGRHPDCHILLDHPSISRRHLEVRCKRRQRRITVTDLSSVHGTRVSGQRIPPNTLVELVAGDTLQLGASKREYRLHWLSLSEAFETEDLLPPLVEEDKEDSHTHQEARNQFVPTQREPTDTETHQEPSHQIVSEQTEFWAKEIPSAPPLPESAHSNSLKESSLSYCYENKEGVVEEKIVTENSVTESVGSSTIQAAGTPVQSDKQNVSGTMPRKAKLKSVKSLCIDTGRRSRTLSYSYQKEEAQYENLVCSQNCKGECAACMVLFDNSDVKEAVEKENMIAPEKGHMNPHVLDSITIQGNQEVPIPLNLEHSDKENSVPNFAKETEQHDIFSENTIPQDSFDAKLQMRPETPDSVSPLVFKYGTFTSQIQQLDSTVHMESCEAVPENPFTQDIAGGNTNNHQEMKHDGLSHLQFDAGLPNKEKMSQNKIAVENCELEGTIFGSMLVNLDIEGKGTEEKEESSLMDKENTTPLVSGNIIYESSQLMLKPTSSQELMDSISPLNLEYDNFSDSENSVLNIGKKLKSNELTSENCIPLMSVETEFMLMSDQDFENDIILEKENSVLAPGKYDAAISPGKQGDLFPDENAAPASRDLKPIAGMVLGSRMDSSVSAECTSNRSIHQRECSELSSEYDAISPGKQGDLFPDENMAPASRDLKPIAGMVLGSRMDSSVSAEYTSNRSIHQRVCSELSSEYDAISPGKQGDLFPDENVAPASRELKPIAGMVLGSRMDSSVSAEYTSNQSIHQRECSELSSEYDATSPIRQQDIFPDKENVTPAFRGPKSIGREVLGSRMVSSVSAEYTPNRSIDKRKCNGLSSKSNGFHTVDDEVFYSDKENLTPVSTGGMKVRRCLPKNLFLVDADQDQEAFCSDKENSTPVSSVAQKTRDMSENRARIESAITKKRVEDRLPFQTLLSNSPLRPTSSFDCTQANARATDFSIRLEDELNSYAHKNQESDRVEEGIKVWTMVADTDCLLDNESRKAIMLLKGIKGTHLIIPRIVIRELDCMKQREGLFKRSTKATSILQWIEDCMENESWWIHVQSSSEMLPVAPTPPATPTETQRQGEEKEAAAPGTFNTMLSLFSPRGFTEIFSPRSFADIVSPKTEDRVLDCALLFNKLRGSQNMVILSNSVALKIKAMSEVSNLN